MRSVIRKKVAALVAAAFTLVCLTGCANGAGQKDDPYAAEFAQAREQIDDPELLAMLADDEVTDAEYTQVQQMEIECATQKGLRAWIAGDGTLHFGDTDVTSGLSDEQYHNLIFECDNRYTGIVDPLYFGPQQNPDNTDKSTLILECLKRFKLVDEDMTVDQYNGIDLNNPPWDKLSGDAYGCEIDPLNYAGGHADLTPEEVPQWQTMTPGEEGNTVVGLD
jgi:hypothetical protein